MGNGSTTLVLRGTSNDTQDIENQNHEQQQQTPEGTNNQQQQTGLGGPNNAMTEGINGALNLPSWDYNHQSRLFNKIPSTVSFSFMLIFGLVAIHSFSRDDGYPSATHPTYVAVILFALVGFILLSFFVLLPPPNSLFTFYLGAFQMLFLVIIMGAALALLPWSWAFPGTRR